MTPTIGGQELRTLIILIKIGKNALVAELVDARDSKSRFERSVGSSPTQGTYNASIVQWPEP